MLAEAQGYYAVKICLPVLDIDAVERFAVKLGYPCINLRVGCTSSSTFRLRSYTENRLQATIERNLTCLSRVLTFNQEHGLLFFRITSDLVPFASHPICRFPWQEHFRDEFRKLGAFIRSERMRISMHPDQFTLLTSQDARVVDSSIRELRYHAAVLDLLELDTSAKIQIHLGAAYGDKPTSKRRFIDCFTRLDEPIRRRLVVENDERVYTTSDCLAVSRETGIPVLFDVLHHRTNHSGESVRETLESTAATWRKADGLPMVDYSSQQAGGRKGKHAETIDLADFGHFLTETRPMNFDVMLEVKDKETSALRALDLVRQDRRFYPPTTKHSSETGAWS